MIVKMALSFEGSLINFKVDQFGSLSFFYVILFFFDVQGL
jgi:hypothetical protein